MKVAIIGSGFGGLSLGVRLQSEGYDVTIYEKQSMVGGHASQLRKEGYTFDLGPSLITAPSIIEAIFNKAGEKMSDNLDLIPLDPFYRIYFHDKTYFDYSGDPELMKKEISKFSNSDAEKYDDFMKLSKELYQAVILDRLGSKPFLNMYDFVSASPKLLKTLSILSAYQRVSQFFKDPKIQFVFSFHPLFIGGSPFSTPALYLMIPYLEREEGVWFTKGGMYSVVGALEKAFLKLGGSVELNSEVSEILTEGDLVTGLTSNEKTLKYDLVVSNAHIYETYSKLIKSKRKIRWNQKKLEKSKYSMSTFLIYLGVKKKFPELEHHTLILSERYRGLVDEIFENNELPDDFSMYLHIPSKTDPSMAPEGSESMYVLIPTPNLSANIDWDDMTPKYTEKILNFLEKDFGLEGLKASIEVQEVYTPVDFEKYRNNYLGSAWGLQPLLFQSANFRAHNRSEDFKNLYLVGASTHPGAGVPGVMLTAETTEKLILNDYPVN